MADSPNPPVALSPQHQDDNHDRQSEKSQSLTTHNTNNNDSSSNDTNAKNNKAQSSNNLTLAGSEHEDDHDATSNHEKLPTKESTQNTTATVTPVKETAAAAATIENDDDELPKSSPSPEKEDPSAADENTIFWDGDDDPLNPYNWPKWLKVFNCVLISGLSFVTPLSSSMFAPGVPQLMEEFKSKSTVLASFCVSVYVLGYAAGPMIFAPLSEIYGRLLVYHGSNVGFIGFLIATAKAPTLNSFIAFRFLCGLFGSCPITNGGGTIADMIPQEQRGAAMAAFAIGPLLGPIIGPVIGGVITERLNWRWVFWVIAIIDGVLSLLFLLFARETYAPVILARKVKRLQKETGNPLLRSKLDTGLSTAKYFKRGILRPMKMLVLSPICIICGVCMGLTYAYLYLMFTSLTPIFERYYHFDAIHAGLTFLGLGVGSMVGVTLFSIFSDKSIKKMAIRDGTELDAAGRPKGLIKPEYRLPPLKIGSVLLPVGLFIYGWTAQYKVHWIVPILGTGIMGVGNIITFMSLQLYLVDTFTIYAASALAANGVMRSLAGAVLPLAGIPMYEKLGVGWGNSLLGFIATVMIPLPWLFIKYGEHLRVRYAIKNL